MDTPNDKSSPRIHWTVALIPLVVLIALQVVVIREFGSDALDGASQTALLFVPTRWTGRARRRCSLPRRWRWPWG